MDRQHAIEILKEHVQNENLRRHMLAVEQAMRDYATRLGGDEDLWGLAGLLHDFDWEIHPTLEQHPHEGAPILRQRGVPDVVVRCILSHADHTGVKRTTAMEKALYACDELTGLIVAVALVRPSKNLAEVSVASIKRKWNNDRFASGVNREDIAEGAQELGVELWEHVGHVLNSMKSVSGDLGLSGTA